MKRSYLRVWLVVIGLGVPVLWWTYRGFFIDCFSVLQFLGVGFASVIVGSLLVLVWAIAMEIRKL